MKSSARRISAYSCLAAALLFIAFGSASAETLLGKLTLIKADGKTDVYPVVSGKKIAYPEQALIRITGATLVAEGGSALEIADQDGSFDVGIDKGVIHFRIQPHKAAVSFTTRDGSFDTPKVVTASGGVIEGTVKVDDKGTTIEIADGSVSVLTSDGVKKVSAGEGIVLAQSKVEGESAVETEETVVDNPATDTAPEESSTTGSSKKSDYTAAAVMGVAGAGAVAGVIIGVTTGDNGGGGDSVGSPIE